MKREIALWITPGDGLRAVEITDDTTIENLVESFNLQDYDITIDNKAVDKKEWAEYTLKGVDEVWASKAQKGA